MKIKTKEKDIRAYKMTVTYGVVKEIYYLNGARRKSYGIAAYSNAEEDGTATIILSVNDITPNYKAISNLVYKLNKNSVSLVHIPDIVDDFIS